MSNPTIDDVRDLAQAGHREGNDTPEETLNRLWRKHFKAPEKPYDAAFTQPSIALLAA